MRIDELRHPPVALVLALGQPEAHEFLAAAFRAPGAPPLAFVARPSLDDASSCLCVRTRKRGIKPSLRVNPNLLSHAQSSANAISMSGSEPSSRSAVDARTSASRDIPGVLHRDWLAKHRTRAFAVVCAFVNCDVLNAEDVKALEKVYGYAHVAGAAVVVAGTSEKASGVDVVSEDKISAIKKALNVERNAIVGVNVANARAREVGMMKLAKACAEAARTTYGEECERMTALMDDSWCPGALRARYAFKAGVYAEFKQDWVIATKRYRSAYEATFDGRCGANARDEDVVEALEVSEVLHAKLCVLLLHSGSTTDAVVQMEKHMRRMSPLGRLLSREAAPTFHEWRARQYNAFGDLLEQRLPKPAPIGTPRTHLPAFYFHAAAQCSIARRQAFDAAFDSADEPTTRVDVELGAYVGQLKIAGTENERLTTEQYASYLRFKDTREAISRETIELLTKAHDHYKENSAGIAGGRSFAALISELAYEYLHAGDYKSAHKLFTTVAVVYRRERWSELLCAVLMHLKTCAKALRDEDAYLSICLEMAALNQGAASEHAPAAFAAAIAAMNEPRAEDEEAPTISCGADDLARIFTLKAGFSTLDCVPGEPVQFHVALRSNLAGDLQISHVDVDFTESDVYEWSDSSPRVLRSREWLKLSFDVVPKCGYPCEATSLTLTAKSGYEFVLPFKSDTSACSTSCAHYDELPNSVLEMKIKTHALDVRDAPPRVSIEISTPDGPALVGEMSRVCISVISIADELEDAELILHVTEDEVRSTNAQILSEDGAVIPNGAIAIGAVALRAKWTGTVCLRWLADGPPAALHATLTAKRTGARMTEIFKNKPRTAPVENVAQVSRDAPFTVRRAYLPPYRQSPLVLQDDTCSKSPPSGLMLATLHVGGPAELTLDDLRSDAVGATDAGTTSTSTYSTATVNAGDAFLHVIPLRSNEHGEDSVRVTWHRTHGDSRSNGGAPTVIANEYALPAVTGSNPPLTVELKYPSKLFMGDPFTYEVVVLNATTSSCDIKVSVTDSTGFVFSGIKRGTMYIPPLASSSYYFLLVPIVTGSAVLPEFALSAERFSAKYVPPIESRRVYVRP